MELNTPKPWEFDMSLTDITCKATKPGQKRAKLSDGGGLQLWIMPSGARLWRLLYRHAGRQRVLAIGSYPKVSLTEARKRRDAARVLLAATRDCAQGSCFATLQRMTTMPELKLARLPDRKPVKISITINPNLN